MNATRDTGLVALRPIIQANLAENPENSPGHFQNATLRPILKLQNELLLQLFRHYLQRHKIVFAQLPAAKRPAFIANSLRSDHHLRNRLVGTIIGQFTEQEFEVFATQEQEITRRISDLLIQRLSDQVEKLLGV